MTRSRAKTVRRVVVATALAVVLVGCGGGGADTDSAETAAGTGAAKAAGAGTGCPASRATTLDGGLLRTPAGARPGRTPLIVLVVPGGRGDPDDAL
ncbi:MAG: hypothetical protein QOJ89_4157, partial [bacterium]